MVCQSVLIIHIVLFWGGGLSYDTQGYYNLYVFLYADVKQKLDELITLYDSIKCTTEERSKALEETLDVSEKFWEDLNSLMNTLKDLQDSLSNQELPGLEPSIIREQQEELEVKINK